MTKTLTEQQIRKIIENGTRKAAKVCEQKFYEKPKSLTEQWREGTLERGYYYYKTKVGAKVIGYQCFGLKFPYDYNHNTIDSVNEVLSPVPDYKMFQFLMGEQKFTEEMLEIIINIRTEELLKLNAEYIKRVKKLEKKLKIATKALKEYANKDKWAYCSEDIDYFYTTKPGYRYAEKALEEMEGVK